MKDQLFSDFQAFRGSLNLSFLERTEIIDGLLASLITKQNCFLFGLPGTGKSELVRSAAQGFMGSKFFSYLLSPTTDPSELYGPVAISKLLEDEYTRDVKGYLPDANVAFLDELFRGSSAVLNSLLQLLNERTFNNGRELIKTDIQSVVAATNSFPTEESLQAFTDRFLFRPTVEGLKRPVNKRKLYEWAVSNTRPEVQSELTSSDLKELQKECEEIEISDEFIDIFSETIEMLDSRGLIISDRRRVQIIKFLKGWAIVQGDSEVLPEHLHSTLKHIVYQTPEDISVIKEVVDQCVPTAEKYFREVQKAANGVMHEFASLQSKPVTDINGVNVRIKTMKEYLQDLKIVSRRAEDAMDSGKLKLSPNMKVKAGKICQELTNNIDRVASAISRYQS